jgi:hypothetical protein
VQLKNQWGEMCLAVVEIGVLLFTSEYNNQGTYATVKRTHVSKTAHACKRITALGTQLGIIHLTGKST